jgi:hypothetical protein
LAREPGGTYIRFCDDPVYAAAVAAFDAADAAILAAAVEFGRGRIDHAAYAAAVAAFTAATLTFETALAGAVERTQLVLIPLG